LSRTLRSRFRRFLPALVGSGALLVAMFLLQAGTGSTTTDPGAAQLAVAERSADSSASRGGARTDAPDSLAVAIARAAENDAFNAPAEDPDATTTTTAAPTTTTAAPTTTTTAKPTTTTAKPKPKVMTAPASQPTGNASGSKICDIEKGDWCRLAMCESTDTPTINNGNGYHGAFQFDKRTWNAYGGTGLAHENSAAEQLRIAKKLHAARGWQPWPGCRAKLGLP
jgi:cytoskeletal protein RodZ